MTRRSSRLAALACTGALSLCCATVGEPAPAGPPPFQGVHSLAVVRARVEPGAARPKDALDALAEGLVAGGYETRAVDFDRKARGEAGELARLHQRIESWVASAPPARAALRRAERAGAGAAEAVRRLGVDAVVMYHRLDDRPFAVPPEPLLGDDPFPRRREVVARPAGALSLVDRDGNATFVAWGGVGMELDPTAAVNAAEAIDVLLRVLRGEPEEE